MRLIVVVISGDASNVVPLVQSVLAKVI